MNDWSNWGGYGQSSDPLQMAMGRQAPVNPLMAGYQPAPAQGGGMFGGFLDQYNEQGTKTGQGWGGMALGSAQGLFNAWLGMKQYGLAKDQLAEGKRQFQLNYDAQRTTTNSALEDRQRARVASNPGAYQSVGAYMDQNGIRG